MKYTYKIENLGCANCAAKMENAIKKMDGIISVKLVFMTAKLTIETDVLDMDSIEEGISQAIRKIESDVILKKV